jgi:site-specific DNA-methyltransferase (adenine-specific)
VAIIHQCAKHKIIEADIFDGLAEVQEGSVNLAYIDAPYNTGVKNYEGWLDSWDTEEEYINWCYEWLAVVLTKLKPDASIYAMFGTAATPYIDIWLRSRMTIKSRIIWHYPSSGSAAKNHYTQLHEPILHCVMNPADYTFNSADIAIPSKTGLSGKIDRRKKIPAPYAKTKCPGNVWDFTRVNPKSKEYQPFPTQKPEALLNRVILASSNPGDTVLDLFAGSFTCGTVCKKLKRKSISVEHDTAYCRQGIKRMKIRLSAVND